MVHLDIRPANVFIQSAHDVVLQRNSPTPTAEENTTISGPSQPATSLDAQNTMSVECPPLESSDNAPPAARDIRHEVEMSILKGEYCLKLGDLGHTRHLEEHIPVIEGETRYCPRELIESVSTTNVDLRKCDIFSLGMSVYELCLGRFLGSQDEDGQSEWVNIRYVIFFRIFTIG
jgi:serine/threonine protein kinase